MPPSLAREPGLAHGRPGRALRQEAALHLARINLEAGRLEAARGHLVEVSHAEHQVAKARLADRLAEMDASSKSLKAVPASLESR